MNNKSIATILLAALTVQSADAQRPATASQNMKAYAKSHTSIPFRTSTDISALTIPAAPVKWGMDVAWDSSDNVTRGTNYIGKDVLSIGRVSFQPSDLVDENGNLSAAQQRTLQSRLNNIAISGIRDINLNCDHEVLCNKDNFPNCDQNYANYHGKPAEWVRVIKATMKYCRNKGFNVISVSPFNEPDYTDWKEGTKADFKAIAQLISEDPDFEGVRICGGNTLNCDQALSWYNYIKPYVNEGNTHQLAGSFDNYAKFWQTVESDGNYGTADELHNTMEALVGIHYGMDAGIWWGYDGVCRGEFCRASFFGKEIGYGENRSTWTAGSVYKRPDGRIDAFLGTSERQANNCSYEITSLDRPVYFDGYGPTYNFGIDLPGGTGYQKGQTNAERMVQIHYGEDVPVEPIAPGSYVIMNVNSKKAIGIYNGARTNGTNIVQATYTGKSSYPYQRWIVKPVPERVGGDFSYFYLQSERDTTMLIDMKNWSTAAGGTAIAYAGGGGALEQFFTEYAGNGEYYIRSRHSGLYIEVKDSKTTNNIAIQQNVFTGAANQRWHFMPTNAALELDAPAIPQGLHVAVQSASARLTWTENTESDFAGYMVLRAENSDAPQYDVIGRMVKTAEFIDNSCVAGREYLYKIKAVDQSRNISEASDVVTYKHQPGKVLVARYSLDRTLNDTTVNYLDAVAAGTLSYTTNTKLSDQRSLSFNGKDTYLMVPSGAASHKEMTIATWINFSYSTSNWQRIFDFGNDTEQYMFLTPSNGSEMRFVLKNGGDEQILSVKKMPTSSWHHVAVTLSEDTVTFYLDGEVLATSSDITIRPSDFNPVRNYIGRSQFASDPLFKGYLQDFRIYNYPLASEELQMVIAGEEPTTIHSLIATPTASSEAIYTLDGKRVNGLVKGINIVGSKKVVK